MTVKNKLLISNIILVCVPVLLSVALCFGYYKITENNNLNPTDSELSESGSLAYAQSALYIYESEISGINWSNVKDDDGEDYLKNEDAERISELTGMGYHIRVYLDDVIIYDSLTDDDVVLIEEVVPDVPRATGEFIQLKDKAVIVDVFSSKAGNYRIISVYDEADADMGVLDSMLPVYMISPAAILVLILIVLVATIVTGFLLSRWLWRSILGPLEILGLGTRNILKGDLETPIEIGSDDEIGELGRDFDSMRRELLKIRSEKEEYEKSRAILLNGVAHDLRSPLTSIKGYAHGLRDNIADNEEKRQRYYDAIITRSADLERMMDSLSGLIRIESKEFKFNRECVNLDEYIREFVREQKSYIEKSHVKVVYENNAPETDVFLDIREMHRVFLNILENSVKYAGIANADMKKESKTDEDRSPSIYLGIYVNLDSDADKIVIDLKDNGPGVEEEKMDRLFEPFYRADESRTLPEKGSGIGLSVVKRIVEGHGGNVSAYSEDGFGIRMVLPLAKRNVNG